MSDAPKSELDRLSPTSRAIAVAVDRLEPEALAAALAASPGDPVLQHSFVQGFRGTLMYRMLDKSVLFANSKMGANLVQDALECARLIHAAGGPARSPNPQPGDIAVLFLDTDWSGSSASGFLAARFDELFDAGLVDLETVLPLNTRVGGMLPVMAACKTGNVAALEVVLRRGASVTAPLKRSRHADILALASTVVEKNRGAVLALLSERLMRDRMASSSAPDSRPSPRAKRRPLAV